MANLNYLLLRVLQQKETTEKAFEELHDFITTNTPRIDPKKDTEKYLNDFAKKHPQRAVLGKVNYENGLQVMTDSAMLVARSESAYLKDLPQAEAKDNYPKTETLINAKDLTKPYKISLRALYNASQLFKCDNVKASVDICTNGIEFTLAIEIIEKAYKMTGIDEATIQFKADEKANMKPFYIRSKDKSILLMLTPMRKEGEYTKDLYLTELGNFELVNSDRVVKVSLEAPKQQAETKKAEQVATTTEKAPNKVLPRARGIKITNKGEKATTKQLSYLLLLTGKQYSQDMTKLEASREITRVKSEKYQNLETCEA